jgi:Xaa-Pro aminopeptidase
MLVTNDPSRVMRLTGFDSWYRCLPPKLGIDAFRSRFPVLVANGDARPVLVAKEIDRTNLEAIPNPGVELVFHNPYFSFDWIGKPPKAHPDVLAAVTAVVDGGKAELDPALPLNLYRQLEQIPGAARAATGQYVVPAHHYVIPESRTALPRSGADPDISAATARIAQGLGVSDVVSDWLRRDRGNRFDVLDGVLADLGLDAVMASTPVNVQELSGIPALLVNGDVYAFYVRGDRTIHVFSRREVAWFGLPEPGVSTADTIRGLIDGCRVGVEDEDLPQEAFDGLGLSNQQTGPASVALRRWRELRTWEDLEYYLIGAHVTIAAIDAAISLASESSRTDSPATELDSFARYREVMADEIEKTNRAIRVRPYFTHIFAGNRSHIPASATSFVLKPLTTMKIDAGVEVYDRQGYLRAASDIARSAVGDGAPAEFYDRLDAGLTEVVIDACRPGVTGDQVFKAGMDWLDPQRGELVAAGFAPPGDASFSELFGRDIGHLMGKQEPATTVFVKGNDWTFTPGMTAAAEFQWPIGDYCFGVEDVFMVTEGEPLNLTRPRR